MSDSQAPIKLLWKFHNSRGRIQYNAYIFIGSNVPKDIMQILENIADLSFYDTLIKLNKTEYKKLESYYGEKWYDKFFNIYHINSSINLIKDTKMQRDEIEEKYGNEWYKKHILSRKSIEKDIIYSYEAMIKYENQHKKLKERGFTPGDDDLDVDYRTLSSKINDENIKLSENSESESDKSEENINEQDGGNIDDIKIEYEEQFKVSTINDFSKHKYAQSGGELDDYGQEEEENTYESEELNEDDENNIEYGQDELDDIDKEKGDLTYDEDENDYDYNDEEIENMYREEDAILDDKASNTSNLIKKALENEKIFEKNLSKMVDFDTSNYNSSYDTNLKDVYKKHYVTTQFIYKDDSIKTLRNKICCSLRCNPEFGNDLYLIPSRQYFWIEYFYDDKINKISVGQKWMRKNELLNIDIEPNNNIKVYEELRGQLKILRNNMRRYNNKIRLEDDSNSILYDYESYLVNNEIYMIDLYNELGKNYSPNADALKNIQDIYIKIYFPRVKSDDIRYIIEFLNNQNKNEIQKNTVVFETINNDLILENEIVNTVENIKNNEKYEYLFKENYITQSVIHVNLRYGSTNKLILYKIFNEFILNDKYPFLQYQTTDGNIYYKFSEKHIIEYFGKKKNTDLLTKWFENAPYGISIKHKAVGKSGENFIAINLNDNGRIEYKTQWKEEDMATIDDIKKTYVYVYDLVKKINSEKNKIKFENPHESEFKYAFINTIQKFELPEKFTINHNDLSNFSRYFFPYVSLVIDPKKRQSKLQKDDGKSKYGTYLRYKRVSKYENQARIEQRIMYFIKNFEFTEKSLIDELSRQFNITEEKALDEYNKVKTKWPNLKKARKVLKKLENVPKYKPPGIGIDIQGKEPKKYKIRISGARDKTQLNRIINFMNILIHAYVETYLHKNPKYQVLKAKLEQLKNIATRRNKVDDFVKYSKETAVIKKMTTIDKMRLGFKPEKGENQYSRSCQNSGDDKKRRPQQFTSHEIGDLIKRGYHLNKKKGIYERHVSIKERGKKKDVLLQAVNLADYDEDGNLTGNEIFYTCNPEDNGEHFYIGFLTKSKNPHGQCMPCCFKKPQLEPTTKKKKEFIDSCLHPKNSKNIKEMANESGDKLYVLQDTNKLNEGRVGYLPKFLDIYFNFLLNKTKKIKHHYLASSETGWFFKYGTKQDENPFLNAVSTILDISVDKLKENIYQFLEKDKNMQYFTSLNNGEIKTKFLTIENFMFYLKNSDSIEFDLIGDLLSIPGVCMKNGLNIVVFTKKILVINESFEKEKIREDFYIDCQNPENISSLVDKNKDCAFIIREEKNYYPVVMVIKEDENEKTMEIVKKFKYDDKKDNIVNHVNKFYERACMEQILEKKNMGVSAKVTAHILSEIKDSEYHAKYQYVDSKNKCKFLLTKNNILVPVYPSGSIYSIPMIKNISKYIKNYKNTLEDLEKIYKLTNKKLPLKQIGVYYDKSECMNCNLGVLDKNLMVNAIMTDGNYLVPIEKKSFDLENIKSQKLIIEQNPQIEEIDENIESGKIQIDNRIKNVNLWKYNSEGYELFRLEFSNFINDDNNKNIKSKIQNIIDDNSLNKQEKIIRIKLILYKIIDSDLYDKYKKIVENSLNDKDNTQTGGSNRFIYVADKLPNLDNYKISNDRILCETYNDKDKCSLNPHCKWYHSSCSFIQTSDNIIKMVNKIAEELVSNILKSHELLRIGGYYVSDIGDMSKFTEREGQKIVKSTSSNIYKVLNEIFGRDKIFIKTGKKKTKITEANYQVLNQENQLIDMKTFFLQKIIDDNMNLFRAYANCYYWIKNKYSDLQIRNLGFYNPIQSDLAINFKSYVINWILNPTNIKLIPNNISKYFEIKKTANIEEYLEKFAIKLVNEINTNTSCILELFVLEKINNIPIVVYDEYNTVIYIFDNGLIYDINEDKGKKLPASLNKYINNIDCINLRFIFKDDTNIKPLNIDSIFYK
jgi:hypothetical protein